MFAGVSANQPSVTRWRRLIVRVKLPLCAFRVRRQLSGLRLDSERYWAASLAALTTAPLTEAIATLRDAIERAAHEQATQIVVTTIILVRQGALRSLLRALGRDDLSTVLSGGYGVSEEGRLAAALYDVECGRSSLEAFLGRYGFYGPAVGELSSFTWREDQAPLRSLLHSMASTAPDDPKVAEDRAVEARITAQHELLAGRGAIRRWRIRRTLARADRVLPLRVVAKAAYTQTIDVVRAAARTAGERLVAAGVIDTRDDVFYLTLDELSDANADRRKIVAERKELRLAYARCDIPMTGTGPPAPRPIEEPGAQHVGGTDAGTTITGLGASHGIAEGRVHVVLDAREAGDFEPGDILVCHTTDPSWTSYFLMASAVVIDIGGTLSHGAIVARELAIPCVTNTSNATRVLKNGDRVRVDGDAGEVTVLDPPHASGRA